MSIDWSKAPEGATHFLPELPSRGWLPCWYKNVAGTWFARNVHDCDWYPDHDYQEIFIPLLIEKPSTWTGEGLLPVGSTVRISKDGWELWDVAEQFIGVDVTLVARFMTGDTEMVAVEHPVIRQCCCFRADMIRTPEQIAAEEREASAYGMCAVAKSLTNTDAFILYDAGYRKVTP